MTISRPRGRGDGAGVSVLPGSRSAVLLPVLVLVLLASPASPFGHAVLARSGPGSSAPSTCSGAGLLNNYSGYLRVEGGPLPADAVSQVPFAYAYYAEVDWRNDSTGVTQFTECERVGASTETSLTGAFSLVLALPSSTCDRLLGLCSTVYGPYGPLSLAPTSATPPGYGISVSRTGHVVDVDFVAELTSLVLTPPVSTAVYSVGASESVSVQALAGNGSLSPGSPQFAWSVNGTGWSLRPSASGSSVSLAASFGATPAQLSVTARLTSNGANLSAGPALLSLAAIPTRIATAGPNQTAVDAGRPLTFLLTATGAAGYDYNASVLPGLGLTARPVPCTTGSRAGDVVELDCTTSVTYPSRGTATPVVVVSNGFSNATENLTPIQVRPSPVVAVTPTSLEGYSDVPLTVQVQALEGTGTGPYAKACWDPGDGPTLCSASPGPNWTFRPSYESPGAFNASVWIQDADGVIAALPVPVTIVDAPQLGGLSTNSSTAPVGAPVNLSATLTGGLMPGAFWWNLSGTATSFARGAVLHDGVLSTTWIPSTVGPQYVSLTVVDAFGTQVERTTYLSVTPDPATSLPAVELPPGSPVAAGSSIPLAWQAYDVHGAAARAFAPTAELSLTDGLGGTARDTWVNVSGVGALLVVGPGKFVIPPSAWTLGRLSLTVATVTAGQFEIALSGPGVPVSPSVTVDIAPDFQHLQLYDPELVVGGERTNRTFWLVRDIYGNPAVGASLQVDFESGGTASASTAPVLGGPNGTVGAWVNYTAPSAAGGSLEVRSAFQVLLGPIAIPAASQNLPGPPVLVAVAVMLPVGAMGVGFALWARRRFRPSQYDPMPSDAALEEFVTGRDRVIATVRAAGAADLTHIELAWGSSVPPPELADWVASLVADGTLGARTGPDGVARFCLAGPVDGPAHVILDEEALERATRTRAELLEDDGPESR
ncbi:MAG: hypothetical protein ACLPZM_05135 [Thermoplasmata archaeon]